jgi:spermidine synthase
VPSFPLRFAVPLLLLLSGFAGLGYQVVWIRMLAVGLGHEAVAMLAVVAAFFVGLSLGAWLLDGAIARSRRPGLWYAVLEIAIGVWSVALIFALPAANEALAAAIGPEPALLRRWALSFAGPLLLLAPATVAMGATLPAAERLHARLTGSTRSVGLLYAANALGAAVGAAATLGLLGPLVGFNGALIAFGLANFLCAGLVLAGPAKGEAARAEPAAPPAPPPAPLPAGRGLYAMLALTGLLGVGFEVAVVRALAQTLENTVYSFAAAVAVYLLGATLGGALYQRLGAARWGARATAALLWTLAATTLWGALATLEAAQLYAWLRGAGAVWTAMLAEWAVTALVFLPAAAAMGALFSHLAQAARGPAGGFGRALAANTLGAAAAPLVVGVLGVPALGVVGAMGALAFGYAALALPPAAPKPRALRLAGAAAATVAILAPLDRALVLPGPGERLARHEEGVSATASVIEAADGSRRLVVDGRFVMGGDATEPMDRLQGHAPLLLHPGPERALFLGLGAGATFAAARAHPGLEAEAVELSAPVVAVLDAFAGAAHDIAAAGESLSLRVADARRWVRTTEARYDVIVADTFHPARDGAALLYTVEHFEAVRARLAPGGLFAQWLPLHQLDLQTLGLIVRSFQRVFPDATLSMANASLATPLLMLAGWAEGAPPTLEALLAHRSSAGLVQAAGAVGLDGPLALLGGFMAGPEALAAWAGEGPLNTDAFPRVLFEAPASVYAPLGPPSGRLIALVEALEAAPGDAVALGPSAFDAEFGDRLAAYWRARDAFLRLGATVPVTGDPKTDAPALAPELLRVMAISPDYAPARRPLMALARALGAVDPGSAQELLTAMETLAPAQRREIAALRDALDAAPQATQ